MRLVNGGRIDRSRLLRFSFDGRELTGHPGDTVASALLAAGQVEVAPSLYRGRPRGIFTADCTEPNALVQVLTGAPEPMVPATQLELQDGLRVQSLSGKGWLSSGSDSTRYDKKHVHAEVVVVGGGPAGIAAALAAGRSGARVLLVEQDGELGGSLEGSSETIDGLDAADWVNRSVLQLAELPEVRVLTRTTAVGCYDHGYLLAAEKRPGMQRLWHVRTRQVVLATGAHERPLVFANNDRPGIMLASAVRRYIHRYAVLPGSAVAVCTTSDSAYWTALDVQRAGGTVPVLLDARPEPPPRLVEQVERAGIGVVAGAAVIDTTGDPRITGIDFDRLDEKGQLVGNPSSVECDLLAVCGGWNPAVQLFGQQGGQLRWEESTAAFVPAADTRTTRVVGAARGTFDLAGCLVQGGAAGAEAAEACGFSVPAPPDPVVSPEQPAHEIRPLWLIPARSGDPGQWQDHFVDLQRDATAADVQRAIDAGMRSAEHVKRYTTIGTGSDQGKTASTTAIGLLAHLLGTSPAELGPPSFRAPYTPVSFSLMAGRERGALYDPVRTTPMHRWHVEHGAVFEDVGQWKRPRYYPRPGEDMDAAVRRECLAARTGVAMMDATTLGKIEVVGPDAAEFLNRVYTNGFAKLPVGKARYGMMCTADGMVFDDGVTTRLAEDRFLMSTTTGNAEAVLDWLEEWLQTEWPHLAVHCTSVTEQWATVAVVGPDSREVVRRIAPELDVSPEAFRFMEFRETRLRGGIPARISRISFSGELAYEVSTASWYGMALWEMVHQAGADHGITPYGTETMHVLRAEKGFVVVGQDTDGTVTPLDLGMDWVVAKHKDFIGRRSLARPDTAREDREQLVGLLPVDPEERLPEGAQLVAPEAGDEPPVPMLGHVTSSYRSPVLGRTFALALVRAGRQRTGQVLHAPVAGRKIPVRVTKPVFYDEEGARRDGRASG